MQGLSILYIDDDTDDLFIMKEAVRESHPEVTVITAKSAEDGTGILEKFYKQGKPLPSLIIVDMNMPKVDGKQMMVNLKTNKKWSSIPVVLYTTSCSPEDDHFCWQYNVQCINKPMGYSAISQTIKQLLSMISL